MKNKNRVDRNPAIQICGQMEQLLADDHYLELNRLFRELKLNETRLEMAADAAGAGLWSLDLETNLFWVSDKTVELFRYVPDTEITFADFTAKVHSEDLPRITEEMQRLIREETHGSVEYRIILDGSIRWILSRGAIYHPPETTVTYLMGASVDITERVDREQALARQLEFETLLANISAIFARHALPDNVDSLILSALSTVTEYFGGDQAGLVKVYFANNCTLVTNAYYREGLAEVPADADLMTLFPWSIEQTSRGVKYCFSSLDELPPEAAVDRSSWDVMHVCSALHVPLCTEDNIHYIIVVHALTKPLGWTPETLNRLQIVGEAFVNIIYRKKEEEELRNSFTEIARLKDLLEVEADYLRAEVRAFRSHKEIIGQSEPLKNVLNLVEQVAPTSSTVLIYGETGTGKELIAQAIHSNSPRRSKLMVKVNCAALPSSLVESELFGRERGAYTGALTRQVGRFELADGSTLFLDEIAEMSPELQAKLLRVLQEGEFERLGSPRTIKVDVRLIVATNRNLLEEVKAGRFREDLYYRLSVFPLLLPPLRERAEDVPMLVWEFLRMFNEKMGKKIRRVSKKDMSVLQTYSWPGNIRELRNVVEHAVIVSTGEELNVRLPEVSGNDPLSMLSLEAMETRHIEGILRHTNWRIKGEGGAAQILAINPATLYSRMKKLGISTQR